MPLAGDEVRILDDDGDEVPVGTVGNVYLRSSGDRDFGYIGADRPTRAMAEPLLSRTISAVTRRGGALHPAVAPFIEALVVEALVA